MLNLEIYSSLKSIHRKNFFYEFVCFFFSFLYSYIICVVSKETQNLVSLGYVAYLFTFFSFSVFEVIKNNENLDFLKKRALFFILFSHLGILLGFLIGHGSEQSLWVIDSYEIHVPGSVNIANFLHGSENLRILSSALDRIYLTHWIIGIFFYIFGISPVVSALGLLSVKLITGEMLYRLSLKLIDKKNAVIALLIFATAPTVLFYTLTYYKVAIVQMIVICYCYFYCLFYRRPKFLTILGCLICLFFILNESFYLAPMLAVILIVPLFFSELVKPYIKILIGGAGVLVGWIIFSKYSFVYFDYRDPLLSLREIKRAYNSYADLNRAYNFELPYVLAIIKLYLTPIFSLNKFKMFYDYSLLLIWGSFVHQFIAIMMIFGLVFIPKSFKKYDYLLLIPFLLFLLLFGYIAPYNGRLRDGFYPVICLFSSPGILYLAMKIKGIKGTGEEKLDFSLFHWSYNKIQNLLARLNGFLALLLDKRRAKKRVYSLSLFFFGIIFLGFLLASFKLNEKLQSKIFWSLDSQSPLLTSEMGLPAFIQYGEGRVLFSVREKYLLQAFRQDKRFEYFKQTSKGFDYISRVAAATYGASGLLALERINEGIDVVKYTPGLAEINTLYGTIPAPKEGISSLSIVEYKGAFYTFFCEKSVQARCSVAVTDTSKQTSVKHLNFSSAAGFRAIVYKDKILLVGVKPKSHFLFFLTYDGAHFEEAMTYENTKTDALPAISTMDDTLYLLYIDPKTSVLVNDIYLDNRWRGKEEMSNYLYKELGDLFIYKEENAVEIIASVKADTMKVSLIRGHFLKLPDGILANLKKRYFSFIHSF